MRVARSKEFWSGLMFIGFGLGFVIIARDYTLGTAARMGPAYFPTVLGGVLILLGVSLVVRSLRYAGAALGGLGIRPVIVVTSGVVIFALTLEHLGLIGASGLLIFICSAAGPDFSFLRTLILWSILLGFSILVFHYGLGLPIPITPSLDIGF